MRGSPNVFRFFGKTTYFYPKLFYWIRTLDSKYEKGLPELVMIYLHSEIDDKKYDFAVISGQDKEMMGWQM